MEMDKEHVKIPKGVIYTLIGQFVLIIGGFVFTFIKTDFNVTKLDYDMKNYKYEHEKTHVLERQVIDKEKEELKNKIITNEGMIIENRALFKEIKNDLTEIKISLVLKQDKKFKE
jgi:hypothetical protein